MTATDHAILSYLVQNGGAARGLDIQRACAVSDGWLAKRHKVLSLAGFVSRPDGRPWRITEQGRAYAAQPAPLDWRRLVRQAMAALQEQSGVEGRRAALTLLQQALGEGELGGEIKEV